MSGHAQPARGVPSARGLTVTVLRSIAELEAVPAENFVVRGIFSVGYDQIDATFVGMSLANAQDLYQLGEAVSGLTVMLHDSEPFNTRRAQAEIESLLAPARGAAR